MNCNSYTSPKLGMNLQSLSERDICTKFITPALKKSGWDEMSQIREEVSFTKGRIIVRGQIAIRGKAKRADYILYIKPNIPIALIEAKDANHGPRASPPKESNLPINQFPSPTDRWFRYRAWKGINTEAEQIVLQDSSYDGRDKSPCYYLCTAVNNTIEATGTGKTYTAFQIIWRLWKAGRNILIDQTMLNDFRPFAGKIAKLSSSAQTIEREDGTEITLRTARNKHRPIDTSYEIYFGIHQPITGPEDRQKLYREFSPTFLSASNSDVTTERRLKYFRMKALAAAIGRQRSFSPSVSWKNPS